MESGKEKWGCKVMDYWSNGVMGSEKEKKES
jgi:hypothetical protein